MKLGEEGKIACPFLRYKILREQRFFKMSVFCQYIMVFFSFDCVAFLGAMLLLSTSMVYFHWPLVYCEKIHLVQSLLSLPLFCCGTV